MSDDREILDSLGADMSVPFGAGKEPGEQGSVEWLMSRVGFCTASRFKDVMDFTKAGKPGAKRTAYMWELVTERLTGKPCQHFESTAMMHGTENEPLARMEYEARTGNMVNEVGFIHHPEIAMCGGSPDGLVDDDGGTEFKCPFNSTNHLNCFLSGMPEDHIPQVQGLMMITGRQWWDFGSFDPRINGRLGMYIQRIPRDEEYIAKLQAGITTFLAEVDAIHAKLATLQQEPI